MAATPMPWLMVVAALHVSHQSFSDERAEDVRSAKTERTHRPERFGNRRGSDERGILKVAARSRSILPRREKPVLTNSC